MMTKRALFCIPSFTFGGAEKHSFQTAKVLLEEGYEVYFLAFGKKDGFDTFLQSQRIKTLSFDDANFQNGGPIKKILIIFRLLGVIRQIKPIYIFSGTKHENILIGIVWRFSGAKKFFWHQWGIDHSPLTKLERICALFKPTYVANSRACKKNILERHRLKTSDLVSIIHNTVAVPNLSALTANSNDAYRILMTANFFPEKDHITVVKAFYQLLKKYPKNNVQLIFAGTAPGISNQLLACKSFAFDLGINNEKILFLGKVEDMASLLNSCHLGVLSTRSEGLSNAILEYMSFGLPVIATNIDQNLEVLGEENKDFLFSLGDDEECFRLIEKWYLDPEKLKPNGNMNQKRIYKEYNFERYRLNVKRLL
jgi:glycosyltransferase involved in cell wall biosynthesis